MSLTLPVCIGGHAELAVDAVATCAAGILMALGISFCPPLNHSSNASKDSVAYPSWDFDILSVATSTPTTPATLAAMTVGSATGPASSTSPDFGIEFATASNAYSSAQLAKSLRTTRFTGAPQCLAASSNHEDLSLGEMMTLTSPTRSSSDAMVAVTAAYSRLAVTVARTPDRVPVSVTTVRTSVGPTN